MEELFQHLAFRLMEQNENLSEHQARRWVEYLWEDLESTRAKAGREYKGKEWTTQMVTHWIEQYGPHLHHYQSTNRKFKTLDQDKSY